MWLKCQVGELGYSMWKFIIPSLQVFHRFGSFLNELEKEMLKTVARFPDRLAYSLCCA